MGIEPIAKVLEIAKKSFCHANGLEIVTLPIS